MLQAVDEVLASAARCSGVEETRIFVPFSCNPNMEALAPEGQAFIVDGLNGLSSKAPQNCFVGVQRVCLLQEIQCLHKNPGVVFPLNEWSLAT